MKKKFNALNGWTILDIRRCVFVCTLVCFWGGNNRVWYSQCREEPCGRNLRVGACWRRSSPSLSLSKASLFVIVWTCPGLTVNVMEFTHAPVHSSCHLLCLSLLFVSLIHWAGPRAHELCRKLWRIWMEKES